MFKNPKKSFDKVIGLIPARKGSKGLKNKNMRYLCGKPLIGHTLKAAIESVHINETWVSSDCAETLRYSESFGAKGVKRPDNFAKDTSLSATVVEHFIAFLEQNSISENTLIAFLQPTSPMRTSDHIDLAIEQMKRNGSDKLISVKSCLESPFKSIIIDKENKAKPLMEENFSNHRRQDLKTAYVPNGAMYFFTVGFFQKFNSFPFGGSDTFVMTSGESIDIDGEQDLLRADKLLHNLLK